MKFIQASGVLINLADVKTICAFPDDENKTIICYKTNETENIEVPFEKIVFELDCSEIIIPK